jgi:DNA-binding FadR family transcriptional regulator
MNNFLLETINQGNLCQNSAVTKVTDYIKQKILLKELYSGDKIPAENDLCQILNVGRGSVREAMKILAGINLIRIQRGSGTYISRPEEISFSEALLFKMALKNFNLAKLAEFREQMETSVIKLCISHASAEEIAQMRKNCENFQAAIENSPDDYELLYKLDSQFHYLLANATKNELIEEIYLFVFNIFAVLIKENYRIGQVREDALITIESHYSALEAIEKKDLYKGAYAVQLTLKIWQKWIEKRTSAIPMP